MKLTAKDGLQIDYIVLEAKEPKGCVQIIHGSIEHKERYLEFSEFLKNHGYTVYLPDLRGHGISYHKKIGYLSDNRDGWELYKDDTVRLTNLIKEQHPNLPVILFGHSMGTFILRDTLTTNGDLYDAAIISGTGAASPLLMKLGQIVLKREIRKHGYEEYNQFVHNFIYGDLDKKAKKLGYSAFGTRDQVLAKAYKDDPRSGFTITLDYANELVKGLLKLSDKNSYHINKDLPLLFISGELDPVGGPKLKFVHNAINGYMKNGNEVSVMIYKDALHEMLNEINRADVYVDIEQWIEKKVHS